MLLRKQFDLPVIFLTGEVDRKAASRAAEVGPVDYLVKPVHTRQLVEAIRTAMRRMPTNIIRPNWSSSPNIGDKPRC